jgi:CRP-like cAMP-binding protein
VCHSRPIDSARMLTDEQGAIMRTGSESSWNDDSRTGERPTTASDAQELNPTRRLLREVSLFRDLDEAALMALVAGAKHSDYAKGATLMRRGDPGQSLWIIESGVVELVLESEAKTVVRLAVCERADYFGELCLLDDQPRSASAIAISDCRVVELDRSVLLPHLTQPMLRTMLVEMGARFRRADAALSAFSDQISRSALANAQAAVSVELDAIKTLYQRTERLSTFTLERADQRAREVIERAEGALAEVQGQVAGFWSKLKNRIMPAVLIAGGVFTALGVGSFLDLKVKYDEATRWHDQIGALQARLVSANKALNVVAETMTSLRSARIAASLDRPVETSAELRRAALAYEDAKAELFHRYVLSEDHVLRYDRFEPAVVFEAVDTYASLVTQGTPDGLFVAPSQVRAPLLAALVYVVRSLSDGDQTGSEEPTHQLADIRLRDTFYQIGNDAQPKPRRDAVVALEEATLSAPSARSKDTAALILASLGTGTAPVVNRLRVLLAGEPEAAASAAIALAKFRDRNAWALLKERLTDPVSAYPYAAALARDGQTPWTNLINQFGESAQAVKLTQLVHDSLQQHKHRNCYEQRYKQWLLACFAGSCGKPSNTEIGGVCD